MGLRLRLRLDYDPGVTTSHTSPRAASDFSAPTLKRAMRGGKGSALARTPVVFSLHLLSLSFSISLSTSHFLSDSAANRLRTQRAFVTVRADASGRHAMASLWRGCGKARVGNGSCHGEASGDMPVSSKCKQGNEAASPLSCGNVAAKVESSTGLKIAPRVYQVVI